MAGPRAGDAAPQGTPGLGNWWTAWITTEPSPTPEATRLTELDLTSRTAKMPGSVVA